MPRVTPTNACGHCKGELVLNSGANPAKVGRVECVECGCSFLFGEQMSRGVGCTFSPTEAAASPPVAASESTDGAE